MPLQAIADLAPHLHRAFGQLLAEIGLHQLQRQ